MRRWLLVATLSACTPAAPRLVKFAGLSIPRGETSVDLDVRVGDRLLIEIETTKPLGVTVWAWTLNAPPGWDVDPETGTGLWEVLPGTPPDVSISLLVAAGRDGRGSARAFTVHATVDQPPADTGTPPSDTDEP